MLTGDSSSAVGPLHRPSLPYVGPWAWPLHLTALHPDVGPALRCVTVVVSMSAVIPGWPWSNPATPDSEEEEVAALDSPFPSATPKRAAVIIFSLMIWPTVLFQPPYKLDICFCFSLVSTLIYLNKLALLFI